MTRRLIAKILFVVAVLTCLMTGAAPAQAQCGSMTISSAPSTVTFQGGAGGYSVYDPAEYMQTVNIQVRKPAGLSGCNYFVVLSPGSSGNASQRRMALGGDTLNYNAYIDAGKSSIFKDISTATSSEILSGFIAATLLQASTVDRSFFWTVAPQQVVRANLSYFTDGLTLGLYNGTLSGSHTLVHTHNITFRALVESSVDLSLVDTGASFSIADTEQTLDFGQMTTGQMLSYDTMVRSNNGYVISMQSQNSQKLRHLTLPSHEVPYSVTINGSSVNLSSGGSVVAATSNNVTPASGDRLETNFTIGAMTNLEAPGNYRDVITLTVTAN